MKAAQVYKRESCRRSFQEDLELHLLTGFVVSTPVFFIMGRPVDRLADPELIIDPAYPFPSEEWNAWMIYLASGDMTHCWNYYPFPFDWVGWEKRNVLRFHSMQTIRTKICHRKKILSPA
jgi:hypothetical protein